MKEYKENFITVEKDDLVAFIFNEALLLEKYDLEVNNIKKVIYNKEEGSIYFMDNVDNKILNVLLNNETNITCAKKNIVSFIDDNLEAKHSLLLEIE